MVTVRTFISITTSRGWNMFQMDVNTAFLQGDLYEDVYMELPQGAKSISTPIELNQMLTTIEYDKHVGVNGDEGLEDIGSYQKLIALRAVRYIKGAPGLGILLGTGPVDTLSAYCDSDWASCPNTRRSVTGYHQTGRFFAFMQHPKQSHWDEALRVVRYIKGAPVLGILLGTCSVDTSSAYYDSTGPPVPILGDQSQDISSN
ncbi:PREDICTED: uncharacterized protein LOC109207258 [Nicotiana attenuata]|uniref:uncharacterized protein LOC109207258 n=1 Tax=Nicotiana attenuata TaxID=49451 RepID=UPI0009056994|nr:PREDICTED: uncharacterized protein LOC109207258 [Nicotiana attenuata]